MTHKRARALHPTIAKAIGWSPAIALVGMRQCGKTTLLKELAKAYYNFDAIETVARFERERESLLQAGPFPLVLDEAQKFPPIFDALKAEVDRQKTPGRYLVTGSVRFSARKAIRESMTGRMTTFEIFPLTMAESHSRQTVSFLDCFLTKGQSAESVLLALEKRSWATENQINTYLSVGGLPGICFRRDAAIRDRLYDSHLDTLFGRDLELVSGLEVESARLRELFQLICREQGMEIKFSKLARQIGVSPPTVRKAILAMEALFLLRRHGSGYFAEDLGLSTFVCRTAPLSERMDLIRFVYTELRTNLSYANPLQAELGEYSTRGGVDIPFVMKVKGGGMVAIAIDAGARASEKSLKSLNSYKKKFPKAIGVVIHRGESKDARVHPNGILSIPFTWVP